MVYNLSVEKEVCEYITKFHLERVHVIKLLSGLPYRKNFTGEEYRMARDES